MEEDDETLVNRVLESVGVPKLSSVAGNNQPLPTAASSASQAPAMSSSVQLAHDINYTDQSLDLEMQFPSTNLSMNGQLGEDNSSLDDTVSYNDLFQGYYDDGTTPDWMWAGMLAPEVEKAFGQTPINWNASLLPGGEDTQNEDDAHPDIVSQIAARFGSLQIAPDGKLRYFGTPANAHLLHNNRMWSNSSTQRSLQLDGTRLLRGAELDLDVDPTFEEHLIKTYFSWHNSCHPVVDEAMYWSSKNNSEENNDGNGFSSPVLTNAMCAIGAGYEARYHSALVTFPRPLADFFAERAKTLLEVELDSPCVSTVQALLLLSSHEAGYQRIARSWLYGGMAMRLCFDLGLHIDTNIYVQQGIISAAESRARRSAFWGSYVMNYRASFSLGRPFTLDASEITVSKPGASVNTPAINAAPTSWNEYPSSSATQASPALDSAQAASELADAISEQRVTLCDMVEPIARALYGNTVISNKSLQELSDRASSSMFRWKKNLPSTLRLAEDEQSKAAPQILVLHLEYHYLAILLHRPWTSRRLQPVPAQGHGYRQARKICVTSACEMANILLKFEKHYGYRRLNVETLQILPSAALILIFATVSVSDSGDKAAHIATNLNTVLRALDELSSSYACAREHLESLLLIQQTWHNTSKGSSGKRAAAPEELARSMKRGKI
ncbi:hypothetical protein LTR37_014163 [Vermiconidia calcicola]|uniref:Uncharacterized protein n=1 Tax=Vermiconidia calcicola TaxID=1690605 RepID=A0ACC3MUI0_9PEZI|nr:hypothetical protein LTR37_014163 [Vermiconidia calcicola]